MAILRMTMITPSSGINVIILKFTTGNDVIHIVLNEEPESIIQYIALNKYVIKPPMNNTNEVFNSSS
ncbi:MAG: hypothetical protein RBR05_00160 [Candidatus Methanomethylophilaceae archaeon]|nr:hypothetical protein [Candidatus Methanomethylophilaceae archaeon]MDD3379209.1 hypothetical protein [Candidatus Methanomethylophilaceae archaeon]MDY0223799.1 hypothetical protein [Candidatus Methanomethylophilaceae archaeon]